VRLDDFIELKNNAGDLEIVCLSGPISGEIPYFILTGQSEETIIKQIRKYQDIF
jgi:hypothetical protein